MKKILSLTLAAILLFSALTMFGCGKATGLDAIKKAGKEEMDAAVQFAVDSPYPDPSEVTDDMYTADNERCVAR